MLSKHQCVTRWLLDMDPNLSFNSALLLAAGDLHYFFLAGLPASRIEASYVTEDETKTYCAETAQ